MKLTAVHLITERHDGKPVEFAPGAVFTATSSEAGEGYLASGAARKPTQTELALAAMAEPRAAAPAAPVETDASKAADAAAAASASKPKHIGAGKWVIQTGDTVSEERFDSRDAAQAAIDAPPPPAASDLVG